MTGEFLLEVLCEEIPANALPGIRTQLAEGFAAQLREAGPAMDEIETESTRMLACQVAEFFRA